MTGRWMVWAATIGGALAIAPAAVAGGWATVELSSTPDAVKPGEPWIVELTILQHGRTPLEDVVPRVAVTPGEAGAADEVLAKPTDRPGVYRAQVEVPDSGTFSYTVDDGFTQVHTYPPVRVEAPTASQAAAASVDTSEGVPWLGLGGALGAGLTAAGLTVVLQRRRRGTGEGLGGARTGETAPSV